MLHVPGDLARRRPPAVAVERREMHDSLQRLGRGQAVEQRFPRFPALQRHRRPHHLPEPRGRGGLRAAVARDHHGLVPCRQLSGQRLAGPATVTDNHPDAGRWRRLGGRLRHDEAAVEQRVGAVLLDSEDRHVAEARVAKGLPPLGRADDRARGPVGIGKPPPPFEEPEGEVLPVPGPHELEHDEPPARGEQRAAVRQRLAQVPRGVQDVGGDRQVVAVPVEALRRRVGFNVEDSEVERGFLAAEARLGRREKAAEMSVKR